jgi:hypothetical protein
MKTLRYLYYLVPERLSVKKKCTASDIVVQKEGQSEKYVED